MWKIQSAALQRTGGKAVASLARRALLPAMAPAVPEASGGSSSSADAPQPPATGMHGAIRCYSQTSFALQEQSETAAKGSSTLTLPPNLMFDFKSSFAPQRMAAAAAAPELLEEEDSDNAGDDSVEAVDGEEESDDTDSDEFDGEDEDSPLVFCPDSFQASGKFPVKPLPERLQVSVRDGTSPSPGEVGTIWLDPTVFGVEEIRIDLIAQNVNYIRNKIRGFRKAKSKTVSEVSGSGRKVRNQKGGGIARAGHSRPAHWRGGAKAHGPKNTKNYGNTKLNKRVKTLAMRSVLTQKLMEGNLVVVDHLRLESHKTRPWARVLETEFKVGKALRATRLRSNPHLSQTTSALILDHYLEPEEGGDESEDYHASYQGVPINLWVASSNIPRITVQNHRFLNVYDLLKNEKLILTLSALKEIEEKWGEK